MSRKDIVEVDTSKGTKKSQTSLAFTTCVDDLNIQKKTVYQVMNTLWLPDDMSAEVRSTTIKSAFAMLKNIAPQDGLECMLVSQMVATHHAAMECLRRAMIHDQDDRARNSELKRAVQLLAIYAKQVAVLDKRRKKNEYIAVLSDGATESDNTESTDKTGTSSKKATQMSKAHKENVRDHDQIAPRSFPRSKAGLVRKEGRPPQESRKAQTR